jgi:predicted DNA-binding transcriptional regulator AlpA
MELPASLRVLSASQAAETLGVSKSWLDKLRVAGGGPHFIKLGRRVVYHHADLASWLSERRRASTSSVTTAFSAIDC